MEKDTSQIPTRGWDKIIIAVRTPLGYAVFAVLSGLLILPLSKVFNEPSIQNLLAYAGLSLVFLSIIYVFLMSAFQPEALKGERVSEKKIGVQKEQDKQERAEKIKPLAVPPNLAKLGINGIGFFEDFVESFPNSIKSSSTLTTMFIHSRRWRENNNSVLNQFILKERAKIVTFLPDLRNNQLIEEIKQHFDDGDHLEFFISDAYRYYSLLKNRFPEKVEVRCFSLYPTYSFYKFDNTAIIAMYPTTTKRRSVPTLEISSSGEFWHFLGDDLDLLLDNCKSLSIDEVKEYAQLNKSERGTDHA